MKAWAIKRNGKIIPELIWRHSDLKRMKGKIFKPNLDKIIPVEITEIKIKKCKCKTMVIPV